MLCLHHGITAEPCCVDGTDFVIYHVDHYSCAGSFFQHLPAVDAHAVIAYDEELHQDGTPHIADGPQHIAVGFIPIVQAAYIISGAGGISGAAGERDDLQQGKTENPGNDSLW